MFVRQLCNINGYSSRSVIWLGSLLCCWASNSENADEGVAAQESSSLHMEWKQGCISYRMTATVCFGVTLSPSLVACVFVCAFVCETAGGFEGVGPLCWAVSHSPINKGWFTPPGRSSSTLRLRSRRCCCWGSSELWARSSCRLPDYPVNTKLLACNSETQHKNEW